MVFVVYVLVVLSILSMDLSISQATSRVTFQGSSIVEYHQQWMIQFSRVYSSELEKQMRLEVFKKNVEFIENFNKKENQSYKLGVNEFTDLTQEEFLATYTGLSDINITSQSEIVDKTLPSSNWSADYVAGNSRDWRNEGAVTPVKNQRECACCWAFAVIAAVEGLTKIVDGFLEALSEQEILDCQKVGNNGCRGGSLTGAFDYITQKNGVASEDAYPYKMRQGSCQSDNVPVAEIRGYSKVPSNDEGALLDVVWRQPVTVAIDAHLQSFTNYAGGVYDDQNCGTNMNHAMALVGFGTSQGGIKYWLAKNSWGPNWGEYGYMRIRRNVGRCGVAKYAYYPFE